MNGGSNTFTASATSGAGASKVGVAGSVAINLASAMSQATIGQSTASASPVRTVTITSGGTGAVSLTAEDDSNSTVSAMPSTTDGASGSSVGVGASLGLNLVTTCRLPWPITCR